MSEVTKDVVAARRDLASLRRALELVLGVIRNVDDQVHLNAMTDKMKVSVALLDGEVQGRKQQIAALDKDIADRKAEVQAAAEAVTAAVEAAQSAKAELANAVAETAVQHGKLECLRSEMQTIRARFRA